MEQRLYLRIVIEIRVRINGGRPMSQDDRGQGLRLAPRKKAGQAIRERRLLFMNLVRALTALCVAQIYFASPEMPDQLAVGVGQRAPKLEVGRWIK